MDRQKLTWLEFIKAIALIWIFFNHIAEQLFGYPLIANPSAGWASLPERITQLAPLTGYGAWNIPVNLLRYLGWIGDQGVQLFIIVSGFGLTWGLIQRMTGKLSLGEFYWRRLERIYPLWWGVHLLFIGAWLVTGWGLSLFDSATIISLLGIRVTPTLLYYFSPAWWYFWLLVQLYLVYPILWQSLCKWGPGRLLLWTSVISVVVRGVGLYIFDDFLDAWSRGTIFITRLPEFVFGISLAAWMASQPEVTDKRLNSTKSLGAAIAIYVLGLLLSLTLPGMAFAPFLLGIGIFVILYQLYNRIPFSAPNWLHNFGEWIGGHSYSLYLVHHPVILALVPFGITASFRTSIRILLAMVGTLAIALFLEWSTNRFTGTAQNLVKRLGAVRATLTAGFVAAIVIALLIGIELLVRQLAPQEIYGWGERPALEPDDELGWRLIPSKVTRLRWVSYDYTVEANSLGFPGPEFSREKPEGAYRVMVTGDAFTSAEGVDTFQAWPRLLEMGLMDKTGKEVQVLNFAMTGYGPNQYAAVLDRYVPVYQPDLLIVELFVNDFQDVLWTNEDFQYNIGFSQPDSSSLTSMIRMEHLRRYAMLHVLGPIKEILRNRPNPDGYFLGQFMALEVGNPEIENDGRQLTLEKLRQIQAVATQNGAKVILVFVPAPVQACEPNQLAYYPPNVDINDSNRFDMDRPQKLMTDVAQSLGLPLYDLRKMLSSGAECYYQPHNLHWTVDGHQVVAEYLAGILIRDGYLP